MDHSGARLDDHLPVASELLVAGAGGVSRRDDGAAALRATEPVYRRMVFATFRHHYRYAPA